MAAWSHFRNTWLKPEVYPLVGAMTAALGVCGYAIFNKTRCTTVAWNKNRRITDANLTAKDEVVPVLTAVRGKSTSIFESDRAIFEAQYNKVEEAPMKFTIRVGGEEEEEEEEPSKEVVEVVEKVVEQLESSKIPLSETLDDFTRADADPKVVQAAVDAALDVIHADQGTSSSAGASA